MYHFFQNKKNLKTKVEKITHFKSSISTWVIVKNSSKSLSVFSIFPFE